MSYRVVPAFVSYLGSNAARRASKPRGLEAFISCLRVWPLVRVQLGLTPAPELDLGFLSSFWNYQGMSFSWQRQKGKRPPSLFQTLVHVTSANISLPKVSNTAKPRMKGLGSSLSCPRGPVKGQVCNSTTGE